MNLEGLRQRIKHYCHTVDASESMLAQEIGVHPATLSRKLNGSAQARLTRSDVKQVVRVLAEWDALFYRQEALELLELAGLNQAVFTPEEWQAAPLNRLSDETPPISQLPVAVATPLSELVVPAEPVFRRIALPRFPTLFVGRKWEVATIKRLLRLPDVRLITLSGPGGVGKTRLALQVVGELEDIFEDGACFVNLAPVTTVKELPAAILQALQYEGPTAGLPELFNLLHERNLILLLDNLEQLPDAGAFISDLLKHAPNLKVLVTSRVLLKVYGEYELNVPPLTLPTELATTTPTKLLESEAAALFVERIRAIKPDFELTRDNAPVVAEICARLDGLPLALELAAGRTRLLNLNNLLARLNNRLGLLTGGHLDLPARQQTLRATIEWSYELLTAEEKKLFRQMAVFTSDFTLEAACAIGDETLPVLELVNALLEKSMLCRLELKNDPTENEPELRFEMLETLQEFAWQQALSGNEIEAAIVRHAEYYLRLSQEAAESGDKQRWQWLTLLEREYPNLQAAFNRLLEADKTWYNPIVALQIATNLEYFWRQLGYYAQGIQWIRTALEQVKLSNGLTLDGSAFELVKLRAEHVLAWLEFEESCENAKQAV